jgi:hypothetical protein
MSGVPDDWAKHNSLTSRLAFSHSLSAVFPPSLYAEHPEFFPLIAGQRLQPPPGSGFWNPDIAREDAALYAADAARRHFAAHRSDLSFPLGINDALVWGESPELVALTRGRMPEAGGQRPEGQRVGGTEDQRAGRPSVRGALGTSEIPASGLPSAEPPTLRPSGSPNWFRERPDYSNLVFTFMNRAGAELAKTHPDKYLGALAYYWAENTPRFPLHPQVVPFLTADRAQGYDAGFRQEEFVLQQRWAAVSGLGPQSQNEIQSQSGPAASAGPKGSPASRNTGIPASSDPSIRESTRPSSVVRRPSSAPAPPRRLGLYDYLYGGGFLLPRIHTRLLAENLRHARRVGFTDYYAEVYANWGLDGPMPWLAAQLLQDPEQPLEELLDEYYNRYFREAATPMRRFFARAEELWLAQPGPPYWLKHYRNASQAILFPPAARRELGELLRAAATHAWFGRTRARVAQVSAAFGVTERFTAFDEARDRLKRLALAPEDKAPELPVALKQYLAARREFIGYTEALQTSDPLAVRRFGWDDYLKDDPVPLALLAIRKAASAGSNVGPPLAGEPPGRDEIHPRSGPATSAGPTGEPDVAALWRALAEGRRPEDGSRTSDGRQRPTEPGGRKAAAPDFRNSGIPALRPSDSPGLRRSAPPKQLLRNAAMNGPLLPGRTIAGLPYGVALPAEWQSKVEPAQFHRAAFVGGDAERALRISGTKDTMLSQWAPLPPRPAGDEGTLQHAEITVRGHVSPGTAVHLVFAWLDAQEKHLGARMVRLPDGDWPAWVTLRQAAPPPAGAVWVGLGLRVQNQVAGDWIEAKDFSLTE